MAMTIKVSFELSTRRIADLFVGAFEGGSTYWCARATPDKDEGFSSPWYDDPKFWERENFTVTVKTHDGEVKKITPRKLRTGAEKMAAKSPRAFSDIVSGNDDANTADLFFQYAALGEEVYA